jgi:2-keto-4-pentenoate hydratase/2-oxohepta-3-ene-1,7-dioic acid hydratase in catechol pathway
MKLARFTADGKESYGLQVDANQILDLPVLSRLMKQSIPSLLDNLIVSGEKARRDLESLTKEVDEKSKAKALVPVEKAKLLAPLVSPPKIVCLGLNFRDHVTEQGGAIPEDLVIFMKPRTAIIGPDDTVIKPTMVNRLDYEAELAIIVGGKPKTSAKRKPDSIFSDTRASTMFQQETSNSRTSSGQGERA